MAMNSHIEIALASIQCFADDGTLDMSELNYLLGLAMRDNIVDEEEKRVLGNIFGKITEQDVERKVWNRILDIKKVHGIA